MIYRVEVGHLRCYASDFQALGLMKAFDKLCKEHKVEGQIVTDQTRVVHYCVDDVVFSVKQEDGQIQQEEYSAVLREIRRIFPEKCPIAESE